MFKRENETRLDKKILLHGFVYMVCIVCSGAARHCDDCTSLFRYAKHGVEVFHHRVFIGAIQPVGQL